MCSFPHLALSLSLPFIFSVSRRYMNMKTAPAPTRDEGFVKVGARGATQAGFDVTLDASAPQRPRINPEREAIFATRQVVNCTPFYSVFTG